MHTEFAGKAVARNQAVALGFKIQRGAIVIADAYFTDILISFDTIEICTDTDSTKY